ncbi:XAC2610-related protein [Pedobacter antarcticus]|uniref:XAC2610-related protein n=1 Tax=Pedobacter antarcticus TaxID=34086 RepID=UPI002931CC25|nr:hypothetical protein [Pedobacter antarcticus]
MLKFNNINMLILSCLTAVVIFMFPESSIAQPFNSDSSLVILHDVKFKFSTFHDQNLTISYQDGETSRINLEESPEDKPRYCEIADFNFDGIDDIGFVFTDETGLNLIYNIFIYSPLSKKFITLFLPDLEEDKFRILNPKFNTTDKSLTVSYKSGPSWSSYRYKFGKNYKLKFIGEL